MTAGSYTVGHAVRAAREAHGMSQRGLAAALGVDQTSVAHWESGRNRPSRDVMGDIERVLGLPLSLLLEVRDDTRQLHPDAVELAVRASLLDDRARRMLLAAADAWLAHVDGGG